MAVDGVSARGQDRACAVFDGHRSVTESASNCDEKNLSSTPNASPLLVADFSGGDVFSLHFGSPI
jgi:hypothetical protein